LHRGTASFAVSNRAECRFIRLTQTDKAWSFLDGLDGDDSESSIKEMVTDQSFLVLYLDPLCGRVEFKSRLYPRETEIRQVV
jgi:hypothetical protein